MSKISWAVYKSIDQLSQACEAVKNSDSSCDICPMSHVCLEETSVIGIANDVLHATIADMLTTADEVTSYTSRENYEAEQANLKYSDPKDWD